MSIYCDTHPDHVAVRYIAATKERLCRECWAGASLQTVLAAVMLPTTRPAATEPTTTHPRVTAGRRKAATA